MRACARACVRGCVRGCVRVCPSRSIYSRVLFRKVASIRGRVDALDTASIREHNEKTLWFTAGMVGLL